MSTIEPSTTEPRNWAPSLDLTVEGLSRFDPERVTQAIQSGREAGYKAGLEAAITEGRRRIDGELLRARSEASQLLRALASAAQAVNQSEGRAAAVFAEHVIDVAMDIASAVVDRELAEDHSRATEAVRRAVGELDRAEEVTVRLHPDDAALLGGMDVPEGVRIVADHRITPGDAVAVTSTQTVDARIATALSRARDALGGHG